MRVNTYEDINLITPKRWEQWMEGEDNGGILTFLECFTSTYNGHVLHFYNLTFTIKKKGKLSANLTTKKKITLIFRSSNKQDPTFWIATCLGQHKEVICWRTED